MHRVVSRGTIPVQFRYETMNVTASKELDCLRHFVPKQTHEFPPIFGGHSETYIT